MGPAPLSRFLAEAIVWSGRLAGKVPREVGRQLRRLPFREFCLLNAELERASWMSWDRLALLAEKHHMMPEMVLDFHHVAEDEIHHLRVFEVLADVLREDDKLIPGVHVDQIAERIGQVRPHYLPRARRGLTPEQQPIGHGGKVWSLIGASGESQTQAFRRLLKESDLAGAVRQRAMSLDKPLADLRVVVKTCFMLGYHRRDPSPLVDPALIRDLAAYLCEVGCGMPTVADNRNQYDRFFQHRTVAEVARYFALEPDGFRLVDLSEDQQPHDYGRGMGQTTVARCWREADFRISFGKVRSHPTDMALLSLANLEGVGGRVDDFLFAERQADRGTALMMTLNDFPVHFALLDSYAHVPDGLAGMIGCPRPKQPRRFYAGRDALTVDCVVLRHLGVKEPGTASLLRAACHWFGGWPEKVEVVGLDQPIPHWKGPYSNSLYALISLFALPVYTWGSGRGSLFVPLMDPAAFPPVQPPGALLWSGRALMCRLLGLRLPRRS